ncbi:hypothetical protein FLONG3_8365 [Fusarium longipes]|uniref:5'-3' DNA helicase ZGRF1-like N-terminal domain-containing protein n=1 Tax=Fusarium longipes TaxID=694270 RepID=A0A395S6N3_9HYPO|nr:hypothetical protein FLONG3_8365 [Fusarium longipes]
MTSSSAPVTATVVDFICLFTHDLKRKQKRWQDGVLKYHTFNKRVMVYDDRSHFIGDAHWQGGGDLEPGDEFELDRGSAIVQVSDCTGQREQDLTELLDKRAKEVEKRRSNAGTRTPGSTAGITHTPRNDPNAPHFQLRHRPLNDLVGGTPRIGRAVISPHSPYEVRKMVESPVQQQHSPSEDARPSKRRRQEESPPSKMGHARALFGTTLTLTPFSSSVSATRSQGLPVKTTTKPRNPSTSTRTDLLDASKRTDTSSEPPPCSSNPEELEIRAPNQSAPRRVFTQRASLRELLAGNEQNWNEGHHSPRENVSRNWPQVSKTARPSLHNNNNAISLPRQETEQSERLDNPIQKPSRTAGTRQEYEVDRPSKPVPVPSATANRDMKDPGPRRKQSAETNDKAFLSWLAQSETTLPDHQASVSLTNSRPIRSKKLGDGKCTMDQNALKEPNHKVAREPTPIDEEEQHQPSRRVVETQLRNTILKPPRTNQATASDTHGTKRPLSIDTPSAAHAGAAELPPAKEPRTELRIRSRQRRGLLMMAQNRQGDRTGSLGRSLPSSLGSGSDVHTSDRPAVPSVQLEEDSKMAHDGARGTNPSPPAVNGKDSVVLLEHPSSAKDFCTKSTNNLHAVAVEAALVGESNEDSNSLRCLVDERPQADDEASDHIAFEEDRPSATPPRRTNPSRRTRAHAAQVLGDDEEETATADPFSEAGGSDSQDENSSTNTGPTRKCQTRTKQKAKPEMNTGPQITKMQRKSVKSKEIIGFAVVAEDFSPAGFLVGDSGHPKILATNNMKTTTENSSHDGQLALELSGSAAARQQETVQGITSEDEPQKEPSQEKPPQGERTQTGQVSQQLEAKQQPRIPNPATRGKKAARRQDAAGLPPKFEPSASLCIATVNAPHKANRANDTPQLELPGFCKANGGAWSRHAEDLLGMKRPSKAPPRQ